MTCCTELSSICVQISPQGCFYNFGSLPSQQGKHNITIFSGWKLLLVISNLIIWAPVMTRFYCFTTRNICGCLPAHRDCFTYSLHLNLIAYALQCYCDFSRFSRSVEESWQINLTGVNRHTCSTSGQFRTRTDPRLRITFCVANELTNSFMFGPEAVY